MHFMCDVPADPFKVMAASNQSMAWVIVVRLSHGHHTMVTVLGCRPPPSRLRMPARAAQPSLVLLRPPPRRCKK